MIQQLEWGLFPILAVVAVIAALGVVFNRNPVHSLLSLLVNLVALAGLYLMLNAQFVAAVQILISGGAILALLLLGKMLLSTGDRTGMVSLFDRRTVQAVAVALVFLTLVGSIVYEGAIGGERGTATREYIVEIGQTQATGAVLFTDYLLALGIATVLVLVGIVGAIVLARDRQAEANDGRRLQGERSKENKAA